MPIDRYPGQEAAYTWLWQTSDTLQMSSEHKAIAIVYWTLYEVCMHDVRGDNRLLNNI